MNIKNNNLTKSVLEKIKKEQIKQVPKYKFIMRNYASWLFVIFSIIVSAMAISIIILSFFNMNISIAGRASGGIIRHIMLFVPYFWFLILSLFIIFGLGNFIHTKYGYRHGYIFVVVISLILSSFFGFLIYSIGGAYKVEHYIRNASFNYYVDSELRREQMWTHADSGLLAGVQLNTIDGDIDRFDLVDFTGKTWEIDSNKLDDKDLAIIAVVGKIAIIGTKKVGNVFEACKIIPWDSFRDKTRVYNDIIQFFGKKKHFKERNLFELRNNICK